MVTPRNWGRRRRRKVQGFVWYPWGPDKHNRIVLNFGAGGEPSKAEGGWKS